MNVDLYLQWINVFIIPKHQTLLNVLNVNQDIMYKVILNVPKEYCQLLLIVHQKNFQILVNVLMDISMLIW